MIKLKKELNFNKNTQVRKSVTFKVNVDSNQRHIDTCNPCLGSNTSWSLVKLVIKEALNDTVVCVAQMARVLDYIELLTSRSWVRTPHKHATFHRGISP